MNKKGFTLIELLAVIVILAIIALIAVPIVLNMIENARKSAAKSSGYGYIEAIDNNNELAGMQDEDMSNIPNVIPDGTNVDVSTINIKIKGKKPTSGTLTITNGRVVSASLCINNYRVTYSAPEVTVGSKCSGESTPALTWDKYYYDAGNGNMGETTSFDSSWRNWAQKRTSDGTIQVCAKFSGGTVCLEAKKDYLRQITCEDGTNNCTTSGYVAAKKQEIESKGATCNFFNANPIQMYCGEGNIIIGFDYYHDDAGCTDEEGCNINVKSNYGNNCEIVSSTFNDRTPYCY